MIWESHYWKEDLIRLAHRLRKRKRQKRWPDRSLAKLEKEVFTGCYAVRKLVEAKKLSDRIANGTVLAQEFQASGRKPVTFFNWGRNFLEAYHIDKPKNIKMPILFLCNQFIHSYIFVTRFDERGMLSGIYINSDREKRKRLYFLPLSTFAKLFSMVGKDYPSKLRATFNHASGDYVIKNW